MPRLLYLVAFAAAACTVDDPDTTSPESAVEIADASDEDAWSVLDAEPDAEGDADAGTAEAAVDDDAGIPVPYTLGMSCESDEQCNDQVFCNGVEICRKPLNSDLRKCERAARLPCPAEHACIVSLDVCDCAQRDKDGDFYAARACGGPDCDDSRILVSPGGAEVCDPDGRDEDCDADTFNAQNGALNLDGDEDGDGHLSSRCRNFDEENALWKGGDDCDDHRPDVKPGNTEDCNYVDDNCDGLIDEKVIDGEKVARALMNAFLPDADHDLYGDKNATAVLECSNRIGYVLAREKDALDCDDSTGTINPNALERCDGIDNDCDGLIDVADPDFFQPYEFTDTVVECIAGVPKITDCPDDRLWCANDPIEQGCRSDGTRLSSCRECKTDCQFSCGLDGCDEVVEIAAGNDHACALTGEGRVACWGRGEDGRLGNGSVGHSSTAVSVLGISDAKAIAAGGAHTCAIVGEARTLFCWGRNRSWQLGNRDAGDYSATAVPVFGVDSQRLTGVTQVAAGEQHTCAVLDTGELVCFGEASDGRLGNGVVASQATSPTKVSRIEVITTPVGPLPVGRLVTNAKAVALGGAHSCFLTTSNGLECFGSNTNGQLARELTTSSLARPEPVPQFSDVTKVVTGTRHTCALRQGQVWCWGKNDTLQLGRAGKPGEPESSVPQPVESLTGVTSLATGGGFTCATTSAAQTYCWGSNAGGQLGEASIETTTNIPVAQDGQLQTIEGGIDFTCAVLANHTARCWGHNIYGQLGHAKRLEFSSPVAKQIQAIKSSTP